MIQSLEPNTLNDFTSAAALIASHAEEGTDDTKLPEVLLQVREMYGAAVFNRLLVLMAAIEDTRYDKYGCADVLPLLLSLRLTDDLGADVETLLQAMKQEDDAAYEQAARESAEEANPYRRAAIRLLTKFKEPNHVQVAWELEHL